MKKWPKLQKILDSYSVDCDGVCSSCKLSKYNFSNVWADNTFYTSCAVALIWAKEYYHYTGLDNTVRADGSVAESRCDKSKHGYVGFVGREE